MHIELTLVLLIPAEQLQYSKYDSPLGSLYPFRLVHSGTISLSLNGEICIACSTYRFWKLKFLCSSHCLVLKQNSHRPSGSTPSIRNVHQPVRKNMPRIHKSASTSLRPGVSGPPYAPVVLLRTARCALSLNDVVLSGIVYVIGSSCSPDSSTAELVMRSSAVSRPGSSGAVPRRYTKNI